MPSPPSLSTKPPPGLPRLAVRVPASTSNLGCGFDALGLALGLWIEVRAESGDASRAHLAPEVVLERQHTGPDEWPPEQSDLLRRALALALGEGALPPGLRLRVRSSIPIGRGYGSSGAATAAGLLLGRALAGGGLEPARGQALRDLLKLGLELEGHPDNVTASLVGGCTVCVPREGSAPALAQIPICEDLAFAAAWPPSALPTKRARAALPTSVPFQDAVENARRAALLTRGITTGDPELLAEGLQDRLHVPFRIPLLPGSAEALDAARNAGAIASTLSGAGSGLIAIATKDAARDVAEAMGSTLERFAPGSKARVLEPVLEAPAVTVLP